MDVKETNMCHNYELMYQKGIITVRIKDTNEYYCFTKLEIENIFSKISYIIPVYNNGYIDIDKTSQVQKDVNRWVYLLPKLNVLVDINFKKLFFSGVRHIMLSEHYNQYFLRDDNKIIFGILYESRKDDTKIFDNYDEILPDYEYKYNIINKTKPVFQRKNSNIIIIQEIPFDREILEKITYFKLYLQNLETPNEKNDIKINIIPGRNVSQMAIKQLQMWLYTIEPYPTNDIDDLETYMLFDFLDLDTPPFLYESTSPELLYFLLEEPYDPKLNVYDCFENVEYVCKGHEFSTFTYKRALLFSIIKNIKQARIKLSLNFSELPDITDPYKFILFTTILDSVQLRFLYEYLKNKVNEKTATLSETRNYAYILEIMEEIIYDETSDMEKLSKTLEKYKNKALNLYWKNWVDHKDNLSLQFYAVLLYKLSSDEKYKKRALELLYVNGREGVPCGFFIYHDILKKENLSESEKKMIEEFCNKNMNFNEFLERIKIEKNISLDSEEDFINTVLLKAYRLRIQVPVSAIKQLYKEMSIGKSQYQDITEEMEIILNILTNKIYEKEIKDQDTLDVYINKMFQTLTLKTDQKEYIRKHLTYQLKKTVFFDKIMREEKLPTDSMNEFVNIVSNLAKREKINIPSPEIRLFYDVIINKKQ